MRLLKEKNYPIGMDISSRCMEAVQITRSRKGLELQAVNDIRLESGIIDKGRIKDRGKFIGCLKKILKKPLVGEFRHQDISVSLPDEITFLKLLDIPSGPNDAEAIIASEIEKHIPFSQEEVYLATQKVGKKENRDLFLTAASPKKVIDDYCLCFRESSLNPVALELEPVSICRSVLEEEKPRFKGKSKSYIVLDMGYSHTSIVFYGGGTILFNFSSPVSLGAVIDEIAVGSDVDLKKAEEMLFKKTNEIKQKDKVQAYLEDINRMLGRLLESYYENFTAQGHIEKIIFTGGGADIAYRNDFITTLPHSIEKNISDYILDDLFVKKQKDTLKKEKNIPLFASATGLALGQIKR